LARHRIRVLRNLASTSTTARVRRTFVRQHVSGLSARSAFV
jgi:hypothetical protein